ncbi:MAG: HNH endonuclease, partial [Promethearchaeota archaeon]
MASKYLSSLSKNDYAILTKKLWNIQNHKCSICEENIDLELHITNIDHIVSLANKGKDSEENFAVTHESCNKSKQAANLQVAFDISILNNTLCYGHLKKYQKDHSLKEYDFSFSELQLVNYFKDDKANIKKNIVDSIKHSIASNKDNKLKNYIDFEGKSKDLPISHSAFNQTILSSFVSSKLILKTPIDFRIDEGLNPRELEINQIVKILNIIAEHIYINKFLPEVGAKRIEKKIVDRKDNLITDEHLIAYRLSKKEILYNWVQYIKVVIKVHFTNIGKMISEDTIFQTEFDKQLWLNIENFVKNLSQLPLWKNRSISSTIFSGKNNYDYWKIIFNTGKS